MLIAIINQIVLSAEPSGHQNNFQNTRPEMIVTEVKYRISFYLWH